MALSKLTGSHVQMWELDNKEGRVLKSWCFRTVVPEKALETPLESKESKPVRLKGNQPWILFGKTDAEAEVPILWPPDANSWLFGKDPDARKDWKQKEKRKKEDEMASLIQWTGTWANSRRWWGTEKPSMLQSMGSWRAGHNLEAEQVNLNINHSKSATLICKIGEISIS